MAANANLHKAKDAKNDEFYTQLTDVSNDYSVNDFVFGDLRRLEFIVAQFIHSLSLLVTLL
jgi:hypothetical protein